MCLSLRSPRYVGIQKAVRGYHTHLRICLVRSVERRVSCLHICATQSLDGSVCTRGSGISGMSIALAHLSGAISLFLLTMPAPPNCPPALTSARTAQFQGDCGRLGGGAFRLPLQASGLVQPLLSPGPVLGLHGDFSRVALDQRDPPPAAEAARLLG